MKYYIILFITASLTFNGQNLRKKPKVLFIGNSYTFVNNLPQLIYDVALANGDTMVFDSHCPGGYTFFNHTSDATTRAKINLGNWDYVLLQAQSQEPAFSPSQVNSQTLPYAIALDTMIKNNNPCATTVFYQTWGRKFGDASNCAFYPPICTYTGMQNRLKQSYKMFADTTHGLMAPVGEAFRKSITNNPNLELYQSDQSHPSLEGSYLAACVLYEIFFQKSVLSNTYNPGIGTSTLTFLQTTAHNVINDSLLVWNVGRFSPKANFTHSLISGSNYQFDGAYPWLNHLWYFGDGTTNLGTNLQHQYTSGGLKNVSHVVYEGCKRDSISIQLMVNVTTDLKNNNAVNEIITVFPNPTSHYLILKSNQNNKEYFSGEIYNQLGQKVLVFRNENKIDISRFKTGLYKIVIENKTSTQSFSILKID